jgi:hypothetical protein
MKEVDEMSVGELTWHRKLVKPFLPLTAIFLFICSKTVAASHKVRRFIKVTDTIKKTTLKRLSAK